MEPLSLGLCSSSSRRQKNANFTLALTSAWKWYTSLPLTFLWPKLVAYSVMPSLPRSKEVRSHHVLGRRTSRVMTTHITGCFVVVFSNSPDGLPASPEKNSPGMPSTHISRSRTGPSGLSYPPESSQWWATGPEGPAAEAGRTESSGRDRSSTRCAGGWAIPEAPETSWEAGTDPSVAHPIVGPKQVHSC